MSLSALLSFLFIWVVRSFLCNTVWGYPLPRRIQLTVQSLTFKALNGLLCADVPLRNYSLTHSASDAHMILLHNNASAAMIWVLKLVATLRTCRMTQQCDHFFSVSHSIVTLHYFKSYTQLFFCTDLSVSCTCVLVMTCSFCNTLYFNSAGVALKDNCYCPMMYWCAVKKLLTHSLRWCSYLNVHCRWLRNVHAVCMDMYSSTVCPVAFMYTQKTFLLNFEIANISRHEAAVA